MSLDLDRWHSDWARALLAAAKSLERRRGRARVTESRAIKNAALDLLVERGTPPTLVALLSHLMGGVLGKQRAENRKHVARLAAATYEANYYARVYRERGLGPSQKQYIEPAPVAHVSAAMARVLDAPERHKRGDYRKNVRRLRDDEDYQELVGEILRELVSPTP